MPFLNSVRGVYGQLGVLENADGNLPAAAAWYKSEDAGTSSWPDSSGNGRTATISGGTKSVVNLGAGSGSSKTIRCLEFNTATDITWAPGVSLAADAGAPGNYTWFSVARYRSGSNARIFHGSYANNWLSGFWSANSGTAFHEGWIPGDPTNRHGQNWVISSDQARLYRSNGVTRGVNFGGSFNLNNGVRTNFGYEPSDGYVAEVILYPKVLKLSEIQQVEAYLSNKFGIALG